jgi:hypothetical protein
MIKKTVCARAFLSRKKNIKSEVMGYPASVF